MGELSSIDQIFVWSSILLGALIGAILWIAERMKGPLGGFIWWVLTGAAVLGVFSIVVVSAL